ncbi:uncharacterized protein SPSK_02896 [Sporothrix schenckii 1099-18]|uniref:Uncharacterized protein n=1 Tax=Sporothrix schenckii 1099-18 TaxID=1397361 RepID=A0A0F2M993_SPOSC|nr:uncharacterized protein SPSK_02896 [Sporothrix schenckii 1099-18]KJR86207.1 hypothetical protein SPSK_02896 [Sporothrix schenckii 1099-18]
METAIAMSVEDAESNRLEESLSNSSTTTDKKRPIVPSKRSQEGTEAVFFRCFFILQIGPPGQANETQL